MTTGEKIQSGILRGIENVGGWFFLDNLADQARADRIKKESAYLDAQERSAPVAVNIKEPTDTLSSQPDQTPVLKPDQTPDQTRSQSDQIDLARKANDKADLHTGLLRQINEGIRRSYEAGKTGQDMPSGPNADAPNRLAWAAGKATAWAGNLSDTIVNGFSQIMTRSEGDYGVVNTGTKHGYKAAKTDLPNMTVAQVIAAQARGDFNVAGRYQIIGPTLCQAAQGMGLSGNEKFDKPMRDRIFTDYLLKHNAIGDYLEGMSDNLKGALLDLSKEWASFADPRTGKSYYDKDGINHASVNVPQAAQMLQALRALALAQGTASNTRNSTHTETHINGPINIQTVATDARGIARELPRATRNAFNDNAALAAA